MEIADHHVSVRDARQNPVGYLIAVVAVLFGVAGVLQPQFFVFPDNIRYALWFWTVMLVLYWLDQFRSEDGAAIRAVAAVFAALSGVVGVYLLLNFSQLRQFPGLYSNLDIFAGGVVVFVTIASTYREYGWILTSISVFAVAFGFLGPFLPSILNHGGLGLRTIYANSLEFKGAFGFVTQAGARWVYVFLIYAGLMKAFGGLKLFMQLGVRASRYLSSGVSQTAVISSFVIGSISGSAAANTALTGSFTIPLMKRRGIPPKTAGAIESVASSGGQIMPPVMGIVAFIMADLLELTYTDIIIMATLPGLLFYVMVVISVHLIANKEASEGDVTLQFDSLEEVSDEIDADFLSSRDLYLQLVPFFASLALLVGILVVLRWNPARAAVWAIAALVAAKVAVSALRTAASHGLGADAGRAAFRDAVDVFEGLYQGSLTMAPIAVILANINIIITIFNITGFGNRLALQLVHVAEVSMVVFLGLLMVLIIILGMGMPTIAGYLLTVAVAVPALVEFGFNEPAAHFFVLYIAVMSNITPPVAMTCAVAANIAGADFIETSVEALKIGLPGFVLPYIILLNPRLINLSFPASLPVVVATFCGLALVIVGIHNWGLSRRLTPPQRIGVLSAGSLLIFSAFLVF